MQRKNVPVLVAAAVAASVNLVLAQEIARETAPVVVTQVKAGYTAEAIRRAIAGIVELEAVVLQDGTVGDVTVIKSLDSEYGLDNEAIKALKKWRFKPAMKDGQPVSKTIRAELSFRLQPPYRHDSLGVVQPVVTKRVNARYTRDALAKKIEGTVGLEAVVQEDGSVHEVVVTKSLDAMYGLDEEAVKALKQWEFKPGTKDGRPVPVLIVVEMMFTFRK
jgi:TonB family protein